MGQSGMRMNESSPPLDAGRRSRSGAAPTASIGTARAQSVAGHEGSLFGLDGKLSTPAFVAAPAVCNAAAAHAGLRPHSHCEQRGEHAQAPSVPRLDNAAMLKILPVLLKTGGQSAAAAGQTRNVSFMSDDYAKVEKRERLSEFLRDAAPALYGVRRFRRIGGRANAAGRSEPLHRYHPRRSGYGSSRWATFYQEAAAKLIDLRSQRQPAAADFPHSTCRTPGTSFTTPDQNDILAVMGRCCNRAATPRLLRREGSRMLPALLPGQVVLSH